MPSLPNSNKGLPQLKYPPPAAAKKTPSVQDALTMNRVTSGISGELESLAMKVETLDKEIKADEKGKQEYDDQLFRLGQRRADMEERLAKCHEWIALFDSKIQPLEGKYDQTMQVMQQQYEEAKLRHTEGIKWVQEFDYHPQFKRYNDTFSALPFKPM